MDGSFITPRLLIAVATGSTHGPGLFGKEKQGLQGPREGVVIRKVEGKGIPGHGWDENIKKQRSINLALGRNRWRAFLPTVRKTQEGPVWKASIIFWRRLRSWGCNCKAREGTGRKLLTSLCVASVYLGRLALRNSPTAKESSCREDWPKRLLNI